MPEFALLAWFPIVFLIFNYFKYNPVRATSVALLFGWLFLPEYSLDIPGPIDLSKDFATFVYPFIAAFAYFPTHMRSYKWHQADFIIIGSLLAPLLSALSNDLGVYDGFAGIKSYLFFSFIPYYLGRVFIKSKEDLKEICQILIIGTLVYVPLCWFEIRFSPQLHNMVYGFSQHSFAQTIRWGGYRPMVFLYHGLSLGLLFAVTTAIGYILWKSKSISTIGKYSLVNLLGIIFVTLIAIKSTNAYFLVLTTVFLTFFIIRNKSPALLVIIFSLFLSYPYLSIPGIIPTDRIVNTIATYVSPDRASSMKFRFDNEELLTEKAMQRPLLGWGGWGRSRVYNDEGKDISVTDSLWIIVFGANGFFGLICFSLLQVIPFYFLVKKIPASEWFSSENGPFTALVMGVLLILINNYFNADIIPLFKFFIGSVPLLQLSKSLHDDNEDPALSYELILATSGTRFI